MSIDDIRLKEIEIYLGLVRIKSVRELARQERMQPGQISKWISGLEKKVGGELIERSANGIRPSARGLELLPVFLKLHDLKLKLQGEATETAGSRLTFASSSFLSTHLLPRVISSLRPETKVRIIDLPPTSFINAALRGTFEYCLHSKKLEWPQTWTTREVGFLRWNVYARKHHPVLKRPQKKFVIQFPFVAPVYWTSEGTQYGDDQCPIPFSERIKGHETATAASAAEIVKASDHLAFLPEIVASHHDELQAVKIHGMKFEQKLFLSVKNMVVKQNEFDSLGEAIRNVLLRP